MGHDLLALEFSDLSNLDLGFDLSVTGFETTEIDLLIDGSSKSKSEEDTAPNTDPDIAPITKLGDIKYRIISQKQKATSNKVSIQSTQWER